MFKKDIDPYIFLKIYIAPFTNFIIEWFVQNQLDFKPLSYYGTLT